MSAEQNIVENITNKIIKSAVATQPPIHANLTHSEATPAHRVSIHLNFNKEKYQFSISNNTTVTCNTYRQKCTCIEAYQVAFDGGFSGVAVRNVLLHVLSAEKRHMVDNNARHKNTQSFSQRVEFVDVRQVNLTY